MRILLRRAGVLLVLAAVVTVAGTSCGGRPTPRPMRFTGWLHTSGTRLLDSRGRPVRLEGIAILFSQGQGRPDACGRIWQLPSRRAYDQIANWGFNSVRLAISWANLEPSPPTPGAGGTFVHHWNEAYLRAIDDIVANLASRDIGLILDMHQGAWSPAFARGTLDCSNRQHYPGSGFPVWLYPDAASIDPATAECHFFLNEAEPGVPIKPQEGFIEAWKFLAARYKNNSTVMGFDLLNEPRATGTCTKASMDLTGFYTRVGTAIRTITTRPLLIYEDQAYGGYLATRQFLVGGPVRLPNAVYSWHFYPATWDVGEPLLRAHLDLARRFDQPFWIGEFEFGKVQKSGRIPGGHAWQGSLSAMMTYCKENDISWDWWSYAPPLVSHPDAIPLLQAGF